MDFLEKHWWKLIGGIIGGMVGFFVLLILIMGLIVFIMSIFESDPIRPNTSAPSYITPAPNRVTNGSTTVKPTLVPTSTVKSPTRVPDSSHLGITMEATESYFSNLGFNFGFSRPDKLGSSITGTYKDHNIQIVGDSDVKLLAYVVEKAGNRTDDEVVRFASTVIGVVLPDCDECGKWFEANMLSAFNNNIGASTVIQGIEIKFDTKYPTHFVLSVRPK